MTALVRAVARGREGSFFPVIKTKFKYSVAGLLIYLSLSFYYYISGNSTLAIAFLIISILSPINQSMIPTGGILSGRKLFKDGAKINALNKIFNAIAIISAVYLTNNIIIILSVYLLSNILIQILILIYTVKKYKPNNKIDPEAISYGKHLSYMSLVGKIAYNIDRIIIFHFFGAANLAIYSFAMIIPEKIKGLIKQIGSLAFPKFAVSDETQIKKSLISKIIKFTFALSIITIIYILSAPLIFKYLFPQYLDSVFISQIFAISILLSPQILLTKYLQSKQKIKELYLISILSPGFRIIFYFIFFHLGVIGFIISIIMSRTVNYIVQYNLFKRS